MEKGATMDIQKKLAGISVIKRNKQITNQVYEKERRAWRCSIRGIILIIGCYFKVR